MNQEEADQDVAGEMSEKVDSRGKVMRSEKKKKKISHRQLGPLRGSSSPF